jgi:hypothetical protein
VLFRDPASGYLIADNMSDATIVSSVGIGAPDTGFLSVAVI